MIILIHEFGYQSVKTFVETIRKNENLKVIIHTYKKKLFQVISTQLNLMIFL